MSIGESAFGLITYGLAALLALLYVILLRLTLRPEKEDDAK
jgi:hypothetical protein